MIKGGNEYLDGQYSTWPGMKIERIDIDIIYWEGVAIYRGVYKTN